MLQKEFLYSANDAGVIIAIAPGISILSPIIAPFLGSTVRQKLVACASGLISLAVAFAVIGYQYPIAGISIVGVGYAISVCSFYSTMPMLVREVVPSKFRKNVESLVVGINMAGSGITMIVSNLAIGFIKDKASYRWVCVYLSVTAACGVLCLVVSAVLRRPLATEEDASGDKHEPFDGDVEEDSPGEAGAGAGIEIVVRTAIDDAYYVPSSVRHPASWNGIVAPCGSWNGIVPACNSLSVFT